MCGTPLLLVKTSTIFYNTWDKALRIQLKHTTQRFTAKSVNEIHVNLIRLTGQIQVGRLLTINMLRRSTLTESSTFLIDHPP